MQIRRFALPAVATGAALGVVALTAGVASAHVTVTPSTTAAGSYSVLTFSVGHGCEGSPTTTLTIQMPESIPSVTPTVNPNWDVEKVMETLDEPLTDAHGNEVTERVSQVVYTAKSPLADGFRDTVALQAQLPDAEGEDIVLPVVQTCEEGETGWVETAADGQDADELESPAPFITVSAAEGDGHGHGSEEESDEHAEESDTTEASADSEDNSGNGLAIAGLVAGIGGLALGGAAFARSGKKA